MNLNRQLLLLAIGIIASVSLTSNLCAQVGLAPTFANPQLQQGIQQAIPTLANPQFQQGIQQGIQQSVPTLASPVFQQGTPTLASPLGQPAVQQVFEGGLQPQLQQPAFVHQQQGFTQYMGQRYPLVGSSVDYTPELIGTYAPLTAQTARQIGVQTVTENVLGHGKHSPVNPNGIAQVSYFKPITPQLFGDASNRVGAQSVVGLASLDEAPRLFRDQNIGGGRSIFKAFWDKHWTRMVMIYGGFGNSEDNNADIFDGRASTNLGIVGVDIGRRHSRFMRSSIDFTYRGGNVDFEGQNAGTVRAYTLMKNFHLDLARRGQFRPYIGVGIGGGFLDAEANLGDEFVEVSGAGSFAYQIIGGAAHNISDLASLYAEYRFFSLTSLDVDSSSGIAEGSFTSHDVLFGLRFGY